MAALLLSSSSPAILPLFGTSHGYAAPKISSRRPTLVRPCRAGIAAGTTAERAARYDMLMSTLDTWATEEMLPLLKPVNRSWQPAELLPAPESDGFLEQVAEMRERAAGIPDEYMVSLVGNMITEEALPTYHSELVAGKVSRPPESMTGDEGISDTGFDRWIRGWSAEENRHGDILNRYLYLSGRVDMRQVEVTVQHLIKNGMLAYPTPYHGLIYASFQERATFISHGNTARRAKEAGDEALAKICGLIAADEKRHELAYTKLVGKLFEVDPESAVIALADKLRSRVTMPGARMYDEADEDVFKKYTAVAQSVGVYTAADYGDNVHHFVERWGVERLSEGLSGEGRRARDYVCEMPRRVRKMAELHMAAAEKAARGGEPLHFSWVFNRSVTVRH